MAQKLLVIDDEPDIGEFVCAAAETLGWDCKIATSVSDFLNALDSDTTLILLDLMIPEMDGIELLRILGKEHCEVGIILMSGIGKRVMETADELAASLGLSIVGHLHKPFHVHDLEAALRHSQTQVTARANTVRSKVLIPKVDLDLAIRRNEFVLHYQPLIEIKTDAVIGLEALVRWQHPERGLLFPDVFLGAIEALGLADALGWLVTRLAFSEIGQFADDRGEMPGISINASVHSLSDLALPDTMIELAAQFKIPADKITIEVTEGGLIKELSKTLDVLTRLRIKGVRLSIDDFGTGYSMMQQLRRIPATEMKIDKSLVQKIGTNEDDRVIVQKTVEIGHQLGMQVVVEGVETIEQFDLLKTSGCDIAQGYYFTRPLPPKQLLKWLQEYRSAKS